MDPLTRLSMLTLELQRGARSEPVDACFEWAFEELKRHIAFDSASWSSGHAVPGEAPVVHTWHLHRQPLQMQADDPAIGRSDVVLAAALLAL